MPSANLYVGCHLSRARRTCKPCGGRRTACQNALHPRTITRADVERRKRNRMRFSLTLLMAVLVIQLSFGQRFVFAQQTVQQPVVSVTSVNTTVSVPDRGSAFLGGVSSAQSGRSQYGPLRSGSSTGLSRQSTSISTNVYIHDLQAMDEAILNSAPSNPHSEPRSTRGVPHKSLAIEPELVNVVSTSEKAIQFEKLAQRAEAAGKRSVAKLHWQVAAKYGSKLAEARLAEVPSSTSSPSVRRGT